MIANESIDMSDLRNQSPLIRLTPRNIDSEMVLSTHSDKCFYSENLFRELVTEDVVEAILQQHRIDIGQGELTKYICQKAKRVFTILLCYERVGTIEHFFNHSFTDEMLPVELNKSTKKIQSFQKKFATTGIIQAIFNDATLGYRMSRDFYADYQWRFVTPVFKADQFRYKFHAQHRLPFVDESCTTRKVSYFSVVEKWRIHRDHLLYDEFWNSTIYGQNSAVDVAVKELAKEPLLDTKHVSIGEDSTNDDHPSIALKEVKQLSLGEDDFISTAETEAINLEELRDLNHPHLIKAIAYFIKGNQHFFLFPWAKFGSLREFCKQEPPALHPTYLEWIFKQLCGLSEAITKLHHSENSSESWRHGDLKPDNILCFERKESSSGTSQSRSTCTFVITDVGLTKKHNTATEDRKNATRTQSGTIMYEPPEAELDNLDPKKGRSRRYDIWSMGCIWLELIVWLLYGATGLERFRNEISGHGSFYALLSEKDSAHQGVGVHNMVQKWINWIGNDPRCSEGSAIQRLLELIIRKLLVPEDIKPRLRSRQDSLLLDGKPAARSSDPPLSPSIIRTATSYFEHSSEQPSTRRVGAKEMETEVKAIYKDATKIGLSRIEWLRFDAPKPEGPGQYATKLSTSDAISVAVPTKNSKSVR